MTSLVLNNWALIFLFKIEKKKKKKNDNPKGDKCLFTHELCHGMVKGGIIK